MERHLFYRAEWSQCGLSIRAAQIAWVRQQYSYSVVYCGFANNGHYGALTSSLSSQADRD